MGPIQQIRLKVDPEMSEILIGIDSLKKPARDVYAKPYYRKVEVAVLIN